LTAAGGVKCWGKNHDGQLGDETAINSDTPVEVRGLEGKVTVIASGGQHTCAVPDNYVKCWGDNEDGQLGDGTMTDTLAAREEPGI
jgi:alpha-tubulin suppressor-like RCC1 family protein